MDPINTPIEEFVTALTGLLTLVATIVIGVVGDKVRGVLKDKRLEKAREVVLPALTNAIKYAHKNVETGTVPSREEVLSGAVDYMFANAEDSLKKLGLDAESVRKLILARLNAQNTPTPEAEAAAAAAPQAPAPISTAKN